MSEEVEIGYYVEIKRGSWAKENGKLAQTFPASGLAYSGSLTKEQMEGIDGLIRDYLEGKTTPSHVAQNAMTHTDHPLRHFDRTCPACLLGHAESTPSTTRQSEAPPPEPDEKKFLDRLLCKPVDGIHPREVHRLLWLAVAQQERLSAASAIACSDPDGERFRWLCDAAGRQWDELLPYQMSGSLRAAIDAMRATDGGKQT